MIPFWIFFGILAALFGSKQAQAKAQAKGRYSLPSVTKLTTEIKASAKKWAAARNLPLDWVLATILIESGGNAGITGDGGKSYGLMQINTAVHTARLAKHGYTPQDMFVVDRNIELGTEIMAEFRQGLKKLLAAKSWPGSYEERDLIRIAYKGGLGTAIKALKGLEPYKGYSVKTQMWHDLLDRVSTMSGPLVS